jgi:hypothetical protein
MWNHCRLGSIGWWKHLLRPPDHSGAVNLVAHIIQRFADSIQKSTFYSPLN